jgi:competence protein ComEC
LFVVGKGKKPAPPPPSPRYLLALSSILLAFSLGLLRSEIASWQFGHSSLEAHVGKEISIEGVVKKEPDVRTNTTHLYVDTGADTVLVSTDRYTDISYGDKVLVEGEVSLPEAFTTDLGRTFNYPAYLLARGVEYQISFAEVTVRDSGYGNRIFSALFSLKHSLMNGIEAALGEPYAGLGEGLLLGVKQALGEDLETAFRTSGIIHIVVLSGYNVMLIVSFCLFILGFFFGKKTRLVVAVIGIVCFALLVGLSATVVRASIMASLLLLADFLGRRYDLPRALLFAGVGMVCINPYLLMYDIGFQFSFMATLGLVLVAPAFESFISEGFSKLSIKDFFISTLATQIAVLPLLMYHIGEVSLVALVVNVLVLPLVPAAMLLTFLAGVVALFSVSLALPFGLLAYAILRYIIEVAVFFSGLPLASFMVPPISPWFVLLLYAALAGSIYIVYKLRNKDEIADWVIEEEKETAGAAQSASPTVPQTPVFFR